MKSKKIGSRAFENYSDAKKLFCWYPNYIEKKKEIVNYWHEIVAKDAIEISAPILTPLGVLEKSGHVEAFKEELFSIEKIGLCLRPETTSSIYPHLKKLRMSFSKNPLKITQIGKAFRKEVSTRSGLYRMREFEQMELEILHENENSLALFEEYKDKTYNFFKRLNLEIRFRKLSDHEKPHYSYQTWDIEAYSGLLRKYLEIGSISDRGKNDLYEFSQKEKEKYNIFEVSLGLDRITLLLLEGSHEDIV